MHRAGRPVGYRGRADGPDGAPNRDRPPLARLDPQARYVFYCGAGNHSGLAAALMQQQGITNVINAGGYAELKAAGAK